MRDYRINRRHSPPARCGCATATIGSRPADAQTYGSNELIEAAKKEGKFVYYTADFIESNRRSSRRSTSASRSCASRSYARRAGS
jgi:hypothetical protein